MRRAAVRAEFITTTKSHFSGLQRIAGAWAIAWFAVLSVTEAAAQWQPAKIPLMTRWGRAVTPDSVLPEYPRPQMVRQAWLNLNGLWDYAITRKEGTVAGDVSRQDPRAFPHRVGTLGRPQDTRLQQPPLVSATFRRAQNVGRPARHAELRRRRLGGNRAGQRQAGRHASRRLRRFQLRHHRRPDGPRPSRADRRGSRRHWRRPGQGQADGRRPASPRHAGLYGRLRHLADRLDRACAADEHRQTEDNARGGPRSRTADGDCLPSGCPGRRRFHRGRSAGRRPRSGSSRRDRGQRTGDRHSATQALVAGQPVSLWPEGDASPGRAARRFRRQLFRHAEDRPRQGRRRAACASCSMAGRCSRSVRWTKATGPTGSTRPPATRPSATTSK